MSKPMVPSYPEMSSPRRRKPRESGQAVIEYAFLMVLLATIGIAVIMLAGNQLMGAYQDISYEFTHITDTATLAPDGTTTLPPGATPSATCPNGSQPQLIGHKWKCKNN
jgi:Flp pilus assembly pilin Flp